MTNGGRRAGAGRPKGSYSKKHVLESEARTVLINSLLEDWEPIIEIAKKVSVGDYVVPKGKMRPDTRLLMELVSFVVGKPKQEFNGTLNSPQVQQLTETMQNLLEKK